MSYSSNEKYLLVSQILGKCITVIIQNFSFNVLQLQKFIGKTTTSVVKTTVQIILDEGDSQVRNLANLEINVVLCNPRTQNVYVMVILIYMLCITQCFNQISILKWQQTQRQQSHILYFACNTGQPSFLLSYTRIKLQV